MGFQWNDAVRAAIMEIVRAIFPLLTVWGILEVTDEQQSATYIFVSLVVTLIGLAYKKGQQPGDPVVVGKGSSTGPALVVDAPEPPSPELATPQRGPVVKATNSGEAEADLSLGRTPVRAAKPRGRPRTPRKGGD